MGRKRTSSGRISSGHYPDKGQHGLGLYEIVELFGADVCIDDLDDQTRLIAGGVLLGMNLIRHRNARGLDLYSAFRERDL